MSYLNTAKLLDDVQARIQDQTVNLRAKLLIFLNEIAQDIANIPREWEFLKRTATGDLSGGVIAIPADFGRVVSIRITSGTNNYFFTPDEELTEEEYFYTTTNNAETTPVGYMVDMNNITIAPSAAGTYILSYVATVPDYDDSSADTLFPSEFGNLLKQGTLMKYYEYDKDGRYTASNILYNQEMGLMKHLDNRKKPLPKFNTRGYVRDRV